MLVALLLGTGAWAGNLTAVRVGVHADYTRLVFQLDGATPYRLIRLEPKDDGTQLLTMSMQGMAPELDRVPVKNSPHVKGVRVVSAPDGGAELRIRLRGDVELRELVLTGPDRIVLDFFGLGAGQAPPLASLVPPPLSPLASTVGTPEASDFDEARAEPEPRHSIEELHEEAFGAEPVEPAVDPELVAAGVEPAVDPELAAAAVESAVDPELEAAARPAEELGPEDPEAEGLEAEVLGAADSSLEETEDAAGVVSDDAFAGVEIAEVLPEEPAASPNPSEAQETGSGDSGSLLGSPVVLAAIAGLAIVGLLFVLGRRRRSEPEREVLSPFDAEAAPPDDEEVAGAALATEGGLFGSGAPGDVEEVADADAPAPFVAPPEDHDIEPDAIVVPKAAALRSEEPDMSAGHDEPHIATTPLVAPLAASEMGAGDVAKMVEEFERRIAHLENRLEEVVDAKERLERQVGAQTEELRVQRAAIARTQRVLRTIARPEDEASEPAPKL